MEQGKAIDAVVHQYEDLLSALGEFRRFSEEQLNWRPSAMQWSMAECIEHIRLTSHIYAEWVELALDRAPHDLRQPGHHYRLKWISRFFIWLMEPRGTKIPNKIKTTAAFSPGESAYNAELLIRNTEAVLTHNLELLERMRQYNATKLNTPLAFASFIKLPILDALNFVAAHDRRHMQQARNVLVYEAFPHEKKGTALA